MAFNRGQTDRFGRPIPASPGIQQLINADGSDVQQRNRLILPSSIIVSDSDADDASRLDVSSATPSQAGLMSAADKAILDGNWRKIEGTITRTDQAVGVYATATWSALAYKQVRLFIRLIASTGGGTVDEVRMVGLTGTYSSQRVYGFAGAAGSDSSGSKIVVFPAGTAGYRCDYLFDLPAAPMTKAMMGMHFTPTVPPIPSPWAGGNTDTTHEVTGLQLVVTTNVCTFSYELYGLPA